MVRQRWYPPAVYIREDGYVRKKKKKKTDRGRAANHQTGILKGYLKDTHQAISQEMHAYFGPNHPTVSLGAPHIPPMESDALPNGGDHHGSGSGSSDEDEEPRKHISIVLISAEDGRDSMVDLTKTLA